LEDAMETSVGADMLTGRYDEAMEAALLEWYASRSEDDLKVNPANAGSKVLIFRAVEEAGAVGSGPLGAGGEGEETAPPASGLSRKGRIVAAKTLTSVMLKLRSLNVDVDAVDGKRSTGLDGEGEWDWIDNPRQSKRDASPSKESPAKKMRKAPAQESLDPFALVRCVKCRLLKPEDLMVLCEGCDRGFHTFCFGMDKVPDDDYFCAECEALGVQGGDWSGEARSISGQLGNDALIDALSEATDLNETVAQEELARMRQERNNYKEQLQKEKKDAAKNGSIREELAKVKKERDKLRRDLDAALKNAAQKLESIRKRQAGLRAEAEKFEALYVAQRRAGADVAKLQAQLVRLRGERDAYAAMHAADVAEGGAASDLKVDLLRARQERDKYKALYEGKVDPIGNEGRERIRAEKLTLECEHYKELYEAVKDVAARQRILIDELIPSKLPAVGPSSP